MQHWDKSKDEKRDAITRQTNKRKSTARWCKGKEGREHAVEIVLNHNYTSRKAACKWWPVYYSFARRDEGPKDWRYFCRHSLKCTACGKYVEYFLDPGQCPEVTPKPA